MRVQLNYGRPAESDSPAHLSPGYRRINRPQHAPSDSLPGQITGERADHGHAHHGHHQRDDTGRRKPAWGTDPTVQHPITSHCPVATPKNTPPIASAPTAASAATGPRTLPTAPPTAMLAGRAKTAQIQPPTPLARTQADHSRRLTPAPLPGS